jgi:hypothetical protein
MSQGQESSSTRQDEKNLLSALIGAYQQASVIKINTGDILGLVEALNSSDWGISTTANVQLHQLASELHSTIVHDKSFSGERKLGIYTDSGICPFYPDHVGIPLILRTFKGNSPEEAIKWLRKVLATDSATGKTIHALWGVQVNEPVSLTTDVQLVPIDNVPDSYNKQWITGHNYFQLNSPIGNSLNFTPPKSALVLPRQIDPFIFRPEQSPIFTNDEYSRHNDLLQEITLVLTVVGPRVVMTAAKWFTYDDPDFEEASIMSRARSWPALEILPIRPLDYPALEADDAKEVVQKYLLLHGTTRGRVRVALQRLNQALRRHGIGDQAVELATAFEALLGDNDKTEMTHKIKVRCVRLIGGSNDIREANAGVISEAYSIRSKLLHTGNVDHRKSKMIRGEKMEASMIIDHAIRICSDLIKVIIRQGAIPKWTDFDILEQTDI